MTEQRVDILSDVVIARARPERLGASIVVRERACGDLLEVVASPSHRLRLRRICWLHSRGLGKMRGVSLVVSSENVLICSRCGYKLGAGARMCVLCGSKSLSALPYRRASRAAAAVSL